MKSNIPHEGIRALLHLVSALDWDYDREECENRMLVAAVEAVSGERRCERLNVADDNFWAHEKGVFVFHFGAYGDIHVLAFGHLEDALEDAAGWLRDNAPGVFVDDESMTEQYLEALASYGTDEENATDEQRESARDYAETDLTYTESGYLVSWEWGISELQDVWEAVDFAAR